MTPSTFANLLPFAVLAACLYRARLLALAVVPPCSLILARLLELVDTSSASHPLRWLTPVACAGLAGMAGWYYVSTRRHWQHLRTTNAVAKHDAIIVAIINTKPRPAVASLLVLASCAPDLLALHPFFWARFAEWPLVPLQIAVCGTILAVLLAPERWVRRWIHT